MLRSLGVGRFVDLSVWPHIASGELQPVMTEWGSSDAPPFSALYRPEARGDAAVQGFVALHHAAVAFDKLPDFFERLRRQEGTGARALAFLILTGARSGEVRGATRGEVDFEAAVWTVPGERMKAGRDHRVPLPAAALLLVAESKDEGDEALLFPAPGGGQLSDMTLSAVMRRMKVPAVPHGFRSTFRDWCAECTEFPKEVAEMALAHAISDKVEAGRRRGDLFEKRRQLMEDWATFCGVSASVKAPKALKLPSAKIT